MRTLIFGVVWFLVTAALPAYSQTPAVQMHLIRQYKSADCISGQLSVGGLIVYTLERSWEGNIPIISSIPAGRYHGFVRKTTKDRWRIELADVPGRNNIQIHVGNFIPDSVGCILIGGNLAPGMCTLQESQAAVDKFKLAFAEEAAKLGIGDDNVAVVLAIDDSR